MRLVTFEPRSKAGDARVGALVNDDSAIVDLTSFHAERGEFASMLALVRAGESALEGARAAVASARARNRLVSRGDATLLAPLPNPPLMKDWGTMSEHLMFFVRQAARAKVASEPDPEAAYERLEAAGQVTLPENYFTVPRYYVANPLNLMGPDATLEWPSFSFALDYELELAIVIGKTVKNAKAVSARECIFGVTLFNDFTARDIQMQEGAPSGKSKEFDGSYAMGPCIVTLDEIRDLYDITVRSRINGQQQTQDSTRSMRITFEHIIEYASTGMTVHAGEVFATGTFQNGCCVEKGTLLQGGDVIELEADGIGTLRNTIGRRS